MRVLKMCVIMIMLIVLSSRLKAQFTITELQEIRVAQIKANAFDSLFTQADSAFNALNESIYIRDVRLENCSLSLTKHQDIINQRDNDVQYYRNEIRLRDEDIMNLKRKQRYLKIGAISIGSAAIIAALLVK